VIRPALRISHRQGRPHGPVPRHRSVEELRHTVRRLSRLALQLALVFAHWVCDPTAATADQITLAGPPQLVWHHLGKACDRKDYSDVPVRPFLNDRGEVVWLAGNSDGYRVTKGSGGGSDRLATMGRTHCQAQILGDPHTSAVGGRPDSYHSAVWLESPFTADGRVVYALAHNEFHGEWSGDGRYCNQQFPQNRIVLRCGYWNLIAARSNDGGDTFALIGMRPDGVVAPAIALPDPYVFNSTDSDSAAPLQQGMAAQSNIIRWGDYYYVLVLQLVYGRAAHNPLDGVCLFRTDDLSTPHSWRGWSQAHHAYSVKVPQSYPNSAVDPAEHCTPVLPTHYRFTWSYNVVLRRFIVVGIDAAYYGKDRPAFVYVTATLDPNAGELRVQGAGRPLMPIAWIPQWQRDPNVEGAAYPSLLDPSSPELSKSAGPPAIPGDRNFQYSGASPYLYYTRLNPRGSNADSTNRDVVRIRLHVSAE
jgi:hypothetical protein